MSPLPVNGSRRQGTIRVKLEGPLKAKENESNLFICSLICLSNFFYSAEREMNRIYQALCMEEFSS